MGRDGEGILPTSTSIEAIVNLYSQAPGDGQYGQYLSTFERLHDSGEFGSAPETTQTFS
jgi:hypothetical protein